MMFMLSTCELLTTAVYVTAGSPRESDQLFLHIPRSRLKTTGDWDFEVVAPKL